MTPKPYDFRKPAPVPGGPEDRLGEWWRSACALATAKWAKQLPTPPALELGPVRTEMAVEALADLPDGIVGYPVRLHDGLTTLLTVPRPLVLALVAGLLGDASEEMPPDRDPTPLEDDLFLFFLREHLLPAFLETWSGKQPLRPILDRREEHARFARVFSLEEKVVVATFRLRGSFGTTEWVWLWPGPAMQRLLAGRSSEESLPVPGEAPQRMADLVKGLPVDLAVELGRLDLPLAQLAHLRPGDVLLLEQAVARPLAASIAGTDKLRVWPGRKGNRQAVYIEAVRE